MRRTRKRMAMVVNRAAILCCCSLSCGVILCCSRFRNWQLYTNHITTSIHTHLLVCYQIETLAKKMEKNGEKINIYTKVSFGFSYPSHHGKWKCSYTKWELYPIHPSLYIHMYVCMYIRWTRQYIFKSRVSHVTHVIISCRLLSLSGWSRRYLLSIIQNHWGSKIPHSLLKF